MTCHVALLRAVNVGGTGGLPMAELRRICEGIGFERVRTCMQSGNVLFGTSATMTTAKTRLEAGLLDRTGHAVGVVMRDAGALQVALALNPFQTAAPNRVAVLFLDDAPTHDAAAAAKGRAGERIELGRREIYIHYPDGMGQSRLRIPAMEFGTARNLNTVARLAEMAEAWFSVRRGLGNVGRCFHPRLDGARPSKDQASMRYPSPGQILNALKRKVEESGKIEGAPWQGTEFSGSRSGNFPTGMFTLRITVVGLRFCARRRPIGSSKRWAAWTSNHNSRKWRGSPETTAGAMSELQNNIRAMPNHSLGQLSVCCQQAQRSRIANAHPKIARVRRDTRPTGQAPVPRR
jgi:uncharacterized protein (DUF1697 family)